MSKRNFQLDYVKSKSNCKKVMRLNGVMNELRAKLNEFSNADQLEDDPSIIQYICELLENVTTVELKGEEKQNIAINLLVEKFAVLNNEKDIKRLKKQIDYLVDSGLINKVSMSTRVLKSTYFFFQKMFDF